MGAISLLKDLGGDAEMNHVTIDGETYTVGGALIHADEPKQMRKPDFSGWATKAGIECSDGRTILPGAFAHQDKVKVPLVWQHGHSDPTNVLGHTILEHRDEGVYAYGYFNPTEQGVNAKTLVAHGDIQFLSIFANRLVEKMGQVKHGQIREVSLVMAGANPGAIIDNLEIMHADTGQLVEIKDEAVIYTGLELQHEFTEVEHAEGDTGDGAGKSVQDVYEAMTQEQQDAVAYMVGAAAEAVAHSDEEPSDEPSKDDTEHETPPSDKDTDAAKNDTDDIPSDDDTTITHTEKETRMPRNEFEAQKGSTTTEAPTGPEHVISHDDMQAIANDAQRRGSAKAAFEAYALAHGIQNIGVLFPDVQAITNTPEWDKRRTEWVTSVLSGVKKLPFSRVKSLVADITHEQARAKGYIKGTFKREEWFGLSKRSTTPTTIYKKQQLDRDDIIDITDLDVVAWLKGEMRIMMDEEVARAILIGDGRAVYDPEKIKDPVGVNEGAGIRSILHDHELYAASINIEIDPADPLWPVKVIDQTLESMRFYKGSGSPTLFTTLPILSKMLLVRDSDGKRLYRTASDVAAEIGVANIVTVEVMEDEPNLLGIVVNLVDYATGTDRGGDITLFDDFDIDYNQYKYLMETRLSGGLTKIRSALKLMKVGPENTLAVPVSPDYNPATGVITPATTTGVTYKRADTNAVVTAGSPITLADGASLKIFATPDTGYFFASDQEDEFLFEKTV